MPPPSPTKFDRARAFFAQQFGPKGQPNTRRLLHYFELRKLWETQHTAELTRADRDFLREAMRQFQLQSTRRHTRNGLPKASPNDEITGLISDSPNPQNGGAFTPMF